MEPTCPAVNDRLIPGFVKVMALMVLSFRSDRRLVTLLAVSAMATWSFAPNLASTTSNPEPKLLAIVLALTLTVDNLLPIAANAAALV